MAAELYWVRVREGRVDVYYPDDPSEDPREEFLGTRWQVRERSEEARHDRHVATVTAVGNAGQLGRWRYRVQMELGRWILDRSADVRGTLADAAEFVMLEYHRIMAASIERALDEDRSLP